MEDEKIEYEYQWIHKNFEEPIFENNVQPQDFLAFRHQIKMNDSIGELSVVSLFRYGNQSELYRGTSAFLIKGENFENYEKIITDLIYNHLLKHIDFIESKTHIPIDRPSWENVFEESFEY